MIPCFLCFRYACTAVALLSLEIIIQKDFEVIFQDIKNVVTDIQFDCFPLELELGNHSQYSDLNYGLDNLAFGQRREIYIFSKTSRPSVGPTQSPLQWATGALSTGVTLLTSLKCQSLE